MRVLNNDQTFNKHQPNADREEVICNDSYQEYETKPHQFIDEKIVGANVNSVKKVKRRSVDRDPNIGLETNRNLSENRNRKIYQSTIRHLM